MKKILFLLLTVFSISCGLVSNNNEPTKLWHTDVNEAIIEANKTNKPIFAFFTGKTWCSWCKKLEKQILSQETFTNYAKDVDHVIESVGGAPLVLKLLEEHPFVVFVRHTILKTLYSLPQEHSAPFWFQQHHYVQTA